MEDQDTGSTTVQGTDLQRKSTLAKVIATDVNTGSGDFIQAGLQQVNTGKGDFVQVLFSTSSRQ